MEVLLVGVFESCEPELTVRRCAEIKTVQDNLSLVHAPLDLPTSIADLRGKHSGGRRGLEECFWTTLTTGYFFFQIALSNIPL
jgi:hypothetical protein